MTWTSLAQFVLATWSCADLLIVHCCMVCMRVELLGLSNWTIGVDLEASVWLSNKGVALSLQSRVLQFVVLTKTDWLACVVIHNTFQQWMSWLPHRWRTQRNAIRNANCDTLRVIQFSNAHCGPGIPGSMHVGVSENPNRSSAENDRVKQFRWVIILVFVLKSPLDGVW